MLLCSEVLYRIRLTLMIVILLLLLCEAQAFNLLCIFRYGDMGSVERKNIRILIGQLFESGYLPEQISKIMSLYD